MKYLKYAIPTALVALGLLGATVVFANPFYTGTKSQTATASSTQIFMTPGTATTTAIYDSYEQYGTNQTNSGNITLPDSVAVLLQGVASSTVTTINIACEFSDNYNGITGNGDWFQNEIYPATSTGAQTITTPISFSFNYASSTVGGAGLKSTTNTFQKVVVCPVPLRYVRAVISVSGSSTSIWASIIPKKQRN